MSRLCLELQDLSSRLISSRRMRALNSIWISSTAFPERPSSQSSHRTLRISNMAPRHAIVSAKAIENPSKDLIFSRGNQ